MAERGAVGHSREPLSGFAERVIFIPRAAGQAARAP